MQRYKKQVFLEVVLENALPTYVQVFVGSRVALLFSSVLRGWAAGRSHPALRVQPYRDSSSPVLSTEVDNSLFKIEILEVFLDFGAPASW